MIEADAFLESARRRALKFFTGVPCSFLTPFINRVISDPSLAYVGATSEGEAVALAAGAWLAGRKSVVMCQNSGLGNTVNPLTSLNYPFRIPVLLVVTWRGEPGTTDEPQHQLMGEITRSLLDMMQIPFLEFPQEAVEIAPALDAAERAMTATGLPFALVMRRGSVHEEGLAAAPGPVPTVGSRHDYRHGRALPARHEILQAVQSLVAPSAAVIATTGKCGRELFTLEDREQQLYMVGSMGCASALALGVALNVDRPVVILDGDGAALMKLGTLATIGAEAPATMIHVVLDNGVHDSTGGQATVSAIVDFAAAALACNYRNVYLTDDVSGFAEAFSRACESPGPHLIHTPIVPGSMPNLGRPTIKPDEVARRFQSFLAGDGSGSSQEVSVQRARVE